MSASFPALAGASKSERLKLERIRKAQEAQPPPLEPDFPYSVAAFDRVFFGSAPEHPTLTKPPV